MIKIKYSVLGIVFLLYSCEKDTTVPKFNYQIYGTYKCEVRITGFLSSFPDSTKDTTLYLKIEETSDDSVIKIKAPCLYGFDCEPLFAKCANQRFQGYFEYNNLTVPSYYPTLNGVNYYLLFSKTTLFISIPITYYDTYFPRKLSYGISGTKI